MRQWSRHGEVDESDLGSVQSDDEEFEPEPVPPRKRVSVGQCTHLVQLTHHTIQGFTCDHKEVQRKTCVNQDIVNKARSSFDTLCQIPYSTAVDYMYPAPRAHGTPQVKTRRRTLLPRFKLQQVCVIILHRSCLVVFILTLLLSFSAIRAIRNHPKPIKSFAEARTIRGVGEKTALKVS